MSLPASLVARHIRTLQAGGWTQLDIASAARVDRRTIHNVLSSRVTTVHQRTAHAVLALLPSRPPARVPSIGTVRRLQALAVMGWPTAHIGAIAGLPRVNGLMAGGLKRIPRAHAAAIDAVFRTLRDTDGPSQLSRSVAARNGWVPACAWNDIDDPDEQRLTRLRRTAVAQGVAS